MDVLVLRFRDLSVEPGETILRHRKLIAKHDSCWWGWWSRNHELSPRDRLSALAFPRPVYLYDTDQSLVYRANCLGGQCFDQERLAPDVSLTPTYYNSRRLRGWFLFSDIEDADLSAIAGLKCIYMPLAEEDVGWQVDALRDLRQREATMWLLEDSGLPR